MVNGFPVLKYMGGWCLGGQVSNLVNDVDILNYLDPGSTPGASTKK